MRDLDGKVGLVTGAGRGLGQACCELVAREGGKVIVADIDARGAEETVRLIEQAGGEATFVRTDVSQSKDVQAMVRAAIETYGRLDFAVNNAMIRRPGGPD
jgi:NAD(P)-dependent dehydrogenase (short-subunit alcohol dehydrogenase family)